LTLINLDLLRLQAEVEAGRLREGKSADWLEGWEEALRFVSDYFAARDKAVMQDLNAEREEPL